MSSSTVYRILQPSNSDVLCRAGATAETIQCAANPLHARAGRYKTDLAVTSMPKKANTRTHFCYTWAWQYLASVELADELYKRGLTGFRSGPLASSSIPASASFREFQIVWNGGFSSDLDNWTVKTYCQECGLITFNVPGDPPWSLQDLVSDLDFFYLAPSFHAFCSQRAYRAMSEVCGKEFLAVPAAEPTLYPDSVRATSFSWPYRTSPCYRGDPHAIWHKLLELDPNGVLPTQVPAVSPD